MADCVKRIRTTGGDLQYDYNSLYDKPESDTKLETAGAFADAQVVGNKFKLINTQINNVNSQITEIKNSTHVHSADDITSGTLSVDRLPEIPLDKLSGISEMTVPLTQGGTGAENGQEGLQNLLASGAMILSSNQYGSSFPSNPVEGQIFFLKVQ